MLSKENEAKVLILYLMNYAGCCLEYDDIFNLAEECGFMGYFDFSAIFAKLLQENNVRESASENMKAYSVTERGRTIAENLDYLIAADVKNNCAVYTPRLLGLKKLGADFYSSVTPEPENGGYRFTCGIKNKNSETNTETGIFSVSLLIKEKSAAEKMRGTFDERPDYIYRCILGMMTGNTDFIL